MFGYRLAQVLSKVPPAYKAVQDICMISEFPIKLKKRQFVIVLIKHKNNDGHWAAIYRSNQNAYELFDSCGCSEKVLQFYKKHLNLEGTSLYYNITRLQSSSSSTCGDFVIYYIVHRCFNADLPYVDLLNLIFVPSIAKNETKVKKLVYKIERGKFA